MLHREKRKTSLFNKTLSASASLKGIIKLSRGQDLRVKGTPKSKNKPSLIPPLHTRIRIPDDKAEPHSKWMRQVEKFFATEDKAAAEDKPAITDRTEQERRTALQTLIPAQKHVTPVTMQSPHMPVHLTSLTWQTSSAKNFHSRDVSYMLDQAKRSSQIKTRGEMRKEELYSTMGIVEAPLDDFAGSFPETIEELDKVRLKIKSRELSSPVQSGSIDRFTLLLKSDIFKGIPAEFYEKLSQSLADSLAPGGKQRSFQGAPGEDSDPPLRSLSDFGPPSGRYDAIALSKWLDRTLEKLGAISDKDDARFELAQTVYYVCCRELVRQVSVQCVERGLLVWRVWTAYLGLMRSLQGDVETKLNRQAQRNDEKVQRMHECYEAELAEARAAVETTVGKYEKQLKDGDTEKSQVEHEREQARTDVRQATTKISELEKTVSELRAYKDKYRNAKEVITALRVELARDQTDAESKAVPPRHKHMSHLMVCMEEADRLARRFSVADENNEKQTQTVEIEIVTQEAQTESFSDKEFGAQTDPATYWEQGPVPRSSTLFDGVSAMPGRKSQFAGAESLQHSGTVAVPHTQLQGRTGVPEKKDQASNTYDTLDEDYDTGGTKNLQVRRVSNRYIAECVSPVPEAVLVAPSGAVCGDAEEEGLGEQAENSEEAIAASLAVPDSAEREHQGKEDESKESQRKDSNTGGSAKEEHSADVETPRINPEVAAAEAEVPWQNKGEVPEKLNEDLKCVNSSVTSGPAGTEDAKAADVIKEQSAAVEGIAAKEEKAEGGKKPAAANTLSIPKERTRPVQAKSGRKTGGFIIRVDPKRRNRSSLGDHKSSATAPAASQPVLKFFCLFT